MKDPKMKKLNAENIACNIFFLEYRWLLCPGFSSLPLNLSLSNSPSSIACVEKVRQEQKEGMKGKGVGEGRKESFVFFRSHPPSSIFGSHSNFRTITPWKMLAMQATSGTCLFETEGKMRSFLRISFL